MPLYTSAYLRNRIANKTPLMESKLFSEKNKTHTSFDIFLSHSFLDKADVEGLYFELTDMGFSVYVDWIIDPELDRNNVTKESAELVRRRLKMSKCLLLAVSTNAALSKWIPWELGYVDGNTNRCALIPISNDTIAPKSFRRVEYLQLYPYLKRAELGYSVEAFITESSNQYASFVNWIKRNETPFYHSQNIDIL